ncbi:MAG: glycosyltransferase [Deltaproteobacteria bacterium]|nr:glycosyltransferase [Deltaproteobacteria bacterium]
MKFRITQIEDYEPLVGAETIERIRRKSNPLRGLRVVNINSTLYGGGVAEVLSSLTLLMNSLGIRAGWRVIQGTPDFFTITKKMHNALQGGEIQLSDMKKRIYEEVIFENSVRSHLEDHDVVIVHDPQPIPMIDHYPKRKGPWIWRCHIDLSAPHKETWEYLLPFVERYDAVIFSSKEYAQKINTPQLFFMPAINPFNIKNKELRKDEIDERLAHYQIPGDLPLVVQISRFDRWKDPQGVIEAFKLAKKEVDCRLVLLGNFATDDPEGAEIYESLMRSREDRILVLPCGDDTALVNSLQRRAAVVLQNSIREGFGLTVAEAMWKGTPVIGGNVGGIRYQIEDGVNGFLVSSIEEAAERIVRLVKDQSLRKRMGQKARQKVREGFLLTRYLEQYLDLFNSFETVFRLKDYPGARLGA